MDSQLLTDIEDDGSALACVDVKVDTSVSEKHTISIFRAEDRDCPYSVTTQKNNIVISIAMRSTFSHIEVGD
jgi:hypothetical protein